ncbi:hypothetical protein E2C01_004553 [Portunus trituberculatus]|uniref:Uncharacterized protein n=1 Tax=Portunus trituberculatus TaxID=210409 RepID=A0A5B7CQU3_PORTR|nr:hypothetical protein [Portunus trituberculatus]
MDHFTLNIITFIIGSLIASTKRDIPFDAATGRKGREGRQDRASREAEGQARIFKSFVATPCTKFICERWMGVR